MGMDQFESNIKRILAQVKEVIQKTETDNFVLAAK
jgi:hypothetical protein